MATRLRINARAQASAGGTATFSFDTAPPQHVYEGTLTLLPDIAQASLGSIALSPFVGDAPWGTFLGSQISGLIQQWHDDDAPLVVTATGLQPNHAYALWWIGTNYDRAQGDRPELKSPATPLNANITTLSEATLDFQHNDALVASELAIDLEDGGGVTWSLTDDPTNKRMKVGASVGGAASLASVNPSTTTVNGILANNVFVAIKFDAIGIDTDAYFAAGTPTRLTVPTGKTGKYRVFAGPEINVSTDTVIIKLMKNAVSNLSGGRFRIPYVGAQTCPVEWNGSLTAGDFVECYVFQATGGSIQGSVQEGFPVSQFLIHYLGT